MRCPICSEEVADTQQAERWGPEFAHATCVTAFNAGKAEAAAEIEQLRADLTTSMETLAKAQALQAEMLKERAALAQPAAPGWQPIETAPYGPHGYRLIANAETGHVAVWIDGVIHNRPGTAHDWQYGEEITHWAPLPAAPQAPQPGGRVDNVGGEPETTAAPTCKKR